MWLHMDKHWNSNLVNTYGTSIPCLSFWITIVSIQIFTSFVSAIVSLFIFVKCVVPLLKCCYDIWAFDFNRGRSLLGRGYNFLFLCFLYICKPFCIISESMTDFFGFGSATTVLQFFFFFQINLFSKLHLVFVVFVYSRGKLVFLLWILEK